MKGAALRSNESANASMEEDTAHSCWRSMLFALGCLTKFVLHVVWV